MGGLPKKYLVVIAIFVIAAIGAVGVIFAIKISGVSLPFTSKPVASQAIPAPSVKPDNQIKQLSVSSSLPGFSIKVDQNQTIKFLQSVGVIKDGIKLRTKEGGLTQNYIFDQINVTVTDQVQPYGQYLLGNLVYASVSETVTNNTLTMLIQVNPTAFKNQTEQSLGLLVDRVFIQEMYFLHNLGTKDAISLTNEGGKLAETYRDQKIFFYTLTKIP